MKFGLGVGPRVATSVEPLEIVTSASVSPVDNTITLAHPDRFDMVASIVGAYFPEALCHGDKKYCWGAALNMNFAAFDWNPTAGSKSFNTSIEGGIGVAFSFDNAFGLAYSTTPVAASLMNPSPTRSESASSERAPANGKTPAAIIVRRSSADER